MITRSPDRRITRERFGAISTDGRARRICFATVHVNQPKRGTKPGFAGTFNVPFRETIGNIFETECGLTLYPNPNEFGGFWRSIRTEEECQHVEAWARQQGTRLFLRDCLDLSTALGMNIRQSDEGWEGYTDLGHLESRAKQTLDENAVRNLTALFVDTIRALPFYRDARMIAAVPAHPSKTYDLPRELASCIARDLALADVTNRFSFAGAKAAVKNSPLAEKWEAWERSGLSFAPHFDGEPAVILVDDKYQSGTSIQFVASVMRTAGAGAIYGLSAVKTLGDVDNVSSERV